MATKKKSSAPSLQRQLERLSNDTSLALGGVFRQMSDHKKRISALEDEFISDTKPSPTKPTSEAVASFDSTIVSRDWYNKARFAMDKVESVEKQLTQTQLNNTNLQTKIESLTAENSRLNAEIQGLRRQVLSTPQYIAPDPSAQITKVREYIRQVKNLNYMNSIPVSRVVSQLELALQ